MQNYTEPTPEEVLRRDGLDSVADELSAEPRSPGEQGDTKELLLTDTTNAEKISELYGNKIRFDHRRHRWLIWSGHLWNPDRDGLIGRFAISAARARYVEAAVVDDLHQRAAISKWAIQSESKMRLDAATGIAKNLPPIADGGNDWDKDPMLLGCTNGIVDLRTGELRPGERSDRITMSTSIVYDPDATAPRWEQFLREIFEDNTELISYVQKALGYSLTGDMREQVVFFCYGKGSNGKSVFFSTVRDAMGDYAYDAPFSTFQRNTGSTATNDVAALEFRRFVASCEVLANTKINELRIKKLSGGDRETARYLYSEYFSFYPACKIWLFVNHKPVVNDDSLGFWRRVRLIPFNRVFSNSEQDKKLVEVLRSELPGVLAWLVKGCLAWQAEGLDPTPACVLEATEDYQAESDVLGDFVREKCFIYDDAQVKASKLYQAYTTWAGEQGMKEKETLSSTSFGRKMGERYQKKQLKNGIHYFGISLEEPKGEGFDKYLASGEGLGSDFYKPPLYNSREGGFMKNPSNPSHPSPERQNAPNGDTDTTLEHQNAPTGAGGVS